jgi:hypothetical protein
MIVTVTYNGDPQDIVVADRAFAETVAREARKLWGLSMRPTGPGDYWALEELNGRGILENNDHVRPNSDLVLRPRFLH